MGAAVILDDLIARGLVHDSTDRDALAAYLGQPGASLYCGFDPTADSLHVGNLQSLLLLRRFQDAGFRPIALAGGATGMIGDPSGRDAERTLLDDDAISANVAAIQPQLERFLDFSAGPRQAVMVDNRTWTGPMTVLEFLRDVGKHISVNTMLAKDSVKSRLDRESGISFTEFSYMLLQANDFAVLNEQHGCALQVAGSDQWGNIVAGIDLIRRRHGRVAHGLTAPLITGADGRKFGKSTGGGGLWLDRTRTSPYQLFQYFMQAADADVEPWLLRLTLLPREAIADVVVAHQAAPERRSGQSVLARAICEFIHGTDAADAAAGVSAILFGGSPLGAADVVLEHVAVEIPTQSRSWDEVCSLGLVGMLATAFDESRGQVRRNLSGYQLNGIRATELGDTIAPAALLHDRWMLVRRGKSAYAMVEVAPGERFVPSS